MKLKRFLSYSSKFNIYNQKMKRLYTHGKVRGSLIGKESIVNKWNEMCRKMMKKKIEANLEILSATKDGGR